MKKTIKKTLALVVSMLMVLAMALPAMAEGEKKRITVNGLEAGDSVKYVQVIAWDTTNGWVRTSAFSGLDDAVFEAVVGGHITDESATAIAAIGATMTDGGTLETGATSWSKDNMAPGLYMVQAVPTTAEVIYNPVFVAVQADETSGTVSTNMSYDNTGTAKKSVVTVDKTAKDHDDANAEWDEWTTQDVGDLIDYKVETTVPAYLESYTNPVFTVTDELSTGLTFATGENDALTSLTVKVGNTALVEDTDYEVTTKTATKWVISFKDSYLQGRTAATLVTITYQAKITSDAKNVNPENNKVTIDYSRNPSDANDHGTKEDKTTHYTFDIDAGLQGDTEYITSEIIKVAVDKDGKPITEEKEYHNKEKHHPLAGAEFKLCKDAAGTTPYTNSTITAQTRFTTDAMGRMEIKGLDEGTYYLIETQAAPGGYMLLTTPVKFTISAYYKTVEATATCNAYKELDYYEVLVNDKTTSHYTINNGTVTKKTDGTAGDVGTEIENTKGVSLPSTGGMGTTIFYVIGGLLVLAAAIVLISRRRVQQ